MSGSHVDCIAPTKTKTKPKKNQKKNQKKTLKQVESYCTKIPTNLCDSKFRHTDCD